MLRLFPLHFSHALCAHWNCCYQVMLTCRRTRSSTMSDGLRWTFCWLIVMSPECMGTTTSRAFLTGAQSSCNVWQRLLPWWFGTKANHLRQLSDNCMLLWKWFLMVQYSTSRAVITGCIHSPISGPGTLPKPVLHVNPECFSLHNLDLLFNPIYTANIHYVDRERESRVYFRERMMEIITTPIVCVCVHMSGSRYVHRLDPAAFAPTPFRKR